MSYIQLNQLKNNLQCDTWLQKLNVLKYHAVVNKSYFEMCTTHKKN